MGGTEEKLFPKREVIDLTTRQINDFSLQKGNVMIIKRQCIGNTQYKICLGDRQLPHLKTSKSPKQVRLVPLHTLVCWRRVLKTNFNTKNAMSFQ